MALAALDDGHTAIIAAQIDGTGTAAITTSDGAATLTDNGTGDYTVTFGSNFLSAPTVVATVIDATYATTDQPAIVILSVATDAVRFNCMMHVDHTGAGTDATTLSVGALADMDFHMVAIGKRNR